MQQQTVFTNGFPKVFQSPWSNIFYIFYSALVMGFALYMQISLDSLNPFMILLVVNGGCKSCSCVFRNVLKLLDYLTT